MEVRNVRMMLRKDLVVVLSLVTQDKKLENGGGDGTEAQGLAIGEPPWHS